MNYRGLCAELTDRLAQHVSADDPLLDHARSVLSTPIGRHFQNGLENYTTVLTPEKVRELRRLRREGLSLGQLAIRFGISTRQVGRICNGTAWGWLND